MPSKLKDKTAAISRGEILKVYPHALELCGIQVRSHGKILTVRKGDGTKFELVLAPNTYVFDRLTDPDPPGLNNRDYFLTESAGELQSISKICDNGQGEMATSKVYPAYRMRRNLKIAPGTTLKLSCQESTSQSDFAAVKWLNTYHYRSLNMWGRSTALVLRVEYHGVKLPYDNAVGYIMLNSPPIMTKPRDEVMQWDKCGRASNIDRVVRIARVVVHPEFRGLGAGKLLVQAAIQYASEYWNAAGKKPILIETVAEMSRLHPVFELGGLSFCGETAGREQVVVTPAERLDHVMGKGHWKSSLDRMKMTASSAKPYFAAALAECPKDVRLRLKELTRSHALHPKPTCEQKSPAPIISLSHATIMLGQTETSSERRLARMLGFEDESIPATALVEHMRSAGQFLSGNVHDVPEMSSKLSEKYKDAVEALRKLTDEYLQAIEQCESEVLAKQTRISELQRDVLCEFMEPDIAKLKLKKHIERMKVAIDVDIELIHSGNPKDLNLGEVSAIHHQLGQAADRLANSTASDRALGIISAFGLDDVNPLATIVDDFSLDILPGQIVLVEGASGSGKTSLLEALLGHTPLSSGTLSPENLSSHAAAIDLNFPDNVAVIDLFDCSTREACIYLNAAGISEAKVYVKRRHQLSHGQRYRVATALLAASRKSVWVADEFCAFLDPLTSVLVARGVSRVARAMGATLIVASANPAEIKRALNADTVIRMAYGARPIPDPRLIYWKSGNFRDALAIHCGQDWLAATSEHDALWASDLIYHRAYTLYRSNLSISDFELHALLTAEAALPSAKWTEGTVNTQVKHRIGTLRKLFKTQ